MQYFSGCPVLNLMASDWTKKGGLGSPQRFFGDFLCVQKVTRVRGGEPGRPRAAVATSEAPRAPGADSPRPKAASQAGQLHPEGVDPLPALR